ncbi:MAG: DUF2283 domain-containing protein [Nanoarchaeota archaeon]|nr:DUF2283 domain-containing protein [Nanoarchaeota archaeon]
MRATYDKQAQAIYIYVTNAEDKSVFSDEAVPDLVFTDYGINDELIGIEIVGVDELIDVTELINGEE